MNGAGKIRYRILKSFVEDPVRCVDDIEILDRYGRQDEDYLFTVKILYRNDSGYECVILVGARDTWLKFNGIRYETLGDFDRLAALLEREKIENMLEKMEG